MMQPYLDKLFNVLELNRDPEFIEFRERHLNFLTVTQVFLGVVMIIGLSGMDYMLGVERIEELFYLRIVTALALLLDLGVDFTQRVRTRVRMRMHVFIGFYIVLIWAVLSTYLAADVNTAYWAQLNLVLLAWYSFSPFSYREIALHGLIFIAAYNLAVLSLLGDLYPWSVVVEYNAYLLGTWTIGCIVAFLNNRSAAVIFAGQKEIEAEKKKSEDLLLNILPHAVADRLKSGERRIADSIETAGVLFADIANFTELTARVAPEELVRLLDEIFSEFDDLADRYEVEKIKTIGDAYMVVGGLRPNDADHLTRLARMAVDMRELLIDRRHQGQELAIRIGFDTGPVIAGVIGNKKPVYDLWGDTVNTASRMESHGQAGKIHATDAVYAGLKDRFAFAPRGEIQIKGKGSMSTWWLEASL